ncbi:MAG: hypothetical protein HFF38_06835 [Lawsonibacter sp.]|nr:hypothetical protein [Lawsonibacter sp.]
MAYNVEKLTKLKSLKQLAEKINADFATKTELNTLSGKVDGLITAGGEPNVITAIKVNGTAQTIADKAVDLAVPVKLSELTNDSGFQTSGDVSAAISAAISQSGHAVFQKVDAVPEAADAQDNILYLVMNNQTNHYDIYAKVGEEVVLLDDTTVDLSGYVAKEAGKGLSANDFTDELKAKLENGPEVAADTEVIEMLTEVFGAAS